MQDPRRELPAVHTLLALVPDLPANAARSAVRVVLQAVRAGGRAPASWEAAVRERVGAESTPHLRPVINATGVVLHTNLGRAPLSPRAVAAVAAVAGEYTNLELDLDSGDRGERLAGVTPRLVALLGVESALAVNNCAAAVLLALSALAAGREVIVSRGELVEIGGAFRVPDVISACGARLREVGTTNRTRIQDYERAIGPETAVILRVHPSNFHIEGFTERADRAALVALAHSRGLLYVEDLGSGAMGATVGDDDTVPAVCAAGADVVCFSGDKLFGGPQAGILLGRTEPLALLRKHPLYRALRLDRLVLAALEATLIDRQIGVPPPVDSMLEQTPASLSHATAALAAALGPSAEVVTTQGLPGGGSRPAARLGGLGVRLSCASPDRVVARLRHGSPPVIARVADGAVLIDLRAVDPRWHPALTTAVLAALDAVTSNAAGTTAADPDAG